MAWAEWGAGIAHACHQHIHDSTYSQLDGCEGLGFSEEPQSSCQAEAGGRPHCLGC